MDDSGFDAFLARAVPRRAERYVRRGVWTPEDAAEASRKEYAERFPNGRATPHQFLFDVVETEGGTVVGEAWYTARPRGGKVEFWIQWISIWPEHRRRGYGLELLRLLEEEARRHGAEKSWLDVWTDNPGALALYTRFGYAPAVLVLAKAVGPGT